jgi:hypothetical protein
MTVFDNIPRTNLEPANHRIAAFDYLNESARSPAARARGLIEELFARYPGAHARALRRRLRSIDDISHRSAFFELLLHELLLRERCTIVAVEPVIAGTDRSPDFLVEAADGSRFYLEATLATGRSEADAAAQRRLDDVLGAIDAVNAPNVLLCVWHGGAPTRPANLGRVREMVQRWIDGLDGDAVAAGKLNDLDVPRLVIEVDGVRFRIEAVPRRRPGGEDGHAIGVVGHDGVQIVDTHVSIRGAVEKKASRYGDLGLPYIVAVNALGEFARETHAVEGLFGTEAIQVHCVDGEFDWQEVRNPDGAWHNAQGPRNTRVSAVLSTEGVTPWSVSRLRARFILNPWAGRPLGVMPLGIDRRWVANGRLLRQQGHSIGELLGQAPDWPGPEE